MCMYKTLMNLSIKQLQNVPYKNNVHYKLFTNSMTIIINLSIAQKYKEVVCHYLIHDLHDLAVIEYHVVEKTVCSTCWLELENDIHPWNHKSVDIQYMKMLDKMIQSDQPVTIIYVNTHIRSKPVHTHCLAHSSPKVKHLTIYPPISLHDYECSQ